MGELLLTVFEIYNFFIYLQKSNYMFSSYLQIKNKYLYFIYLAETTPEFQT